MYLTKKTIILHYNFNSFAFYQYALKIQKGKH